MVEIEDAINMSIRYRSRAIELAGKGDFDGANNLLDKSDEIIRKIDRLIENAKND